MKRQIDKEADRDLQTDRHISRKTETQNIETGGQRDGKQIYREVERDGKQIYREVERDG